MKRVDLYTKTVLTVIAVCLVVLTLKNVNIIPDARAAVNTPAVTASDKMLQSGGGIVDVRIVGVSYGTELPVKMNTSYNGLPVEIRSVDRTIPVELKTPYGGLEVKVSNYRDFK